MCGNSTLSQGYYIMNRYSSKVTKSDIFEIVENVLNLENRAAPVRKIPFNVISLNLIGTITCLSVLLAPSDAGAFVTHEYSATFINEASRIYFLLTCVLVLLAMLRNRLQKEKGWRYTFFSLICFIIWDIIVFFGQISALKIGPSHFIGGNEGLEYFKRNILLYDNDYFYYFASFDYVLIDIAMLLFYRGLSEHLAEDNRPSQVTAASLVLPLLPVFAVSFAGAVVFIVLSVFSLTASLKLYTRNRENILWHYMIWLSSSFVLFSFSRSLGHVLQHILIASGSRNIWNVIEPVSGSINIISFFIVGSISVFFIGIYAIHLRMLDDKKEIENINLELSELTQELEDIVAERTMSLMALSIADKVRNPAATIGITCRRVLRKKEQGEKLGEDLQNMISECEKLQNVVGDFESLLKTKRSEFSYENLNNVVKDVTSLVSKEAADKGVLLSAHYFVRPININMQKGLMRVAVFHVIRNAIDASCAGGLIQINTSLENDDVVLTISDAGTGINAEDIERIFDSFYSTKNKRFGMGLPLVKQIVTEHLGEIKVESEVGKGTTFKMIFPSRWKDERQKALVNIR
jgi:signal transduction histidine kinase